MLWLKAFHIFFVVSWFAGLFYLPRIFVNLAMVEGEIGDRPRFSDAQNRGLSPISPEYDRLLLMAGKLYRFVTPIGILTLISGFWLWVLFGFTDLWIYVKTALVGGLAIYHLYCGALLKQFAAGRNTRSHVWFRFFNEVPVFFLLAVCILVVVKPF